MPWAAGNAVALQHVMLKRPYLRGQSLRKPSLAEASYPSNTCQCSLSLQLPSPTMPAQPQRDPQHFVQYSNRDRGRDYHYEDVDSSSSNRRGRRSRHHGNDSDGGPSSGSDGYVSRRRPQRDHGVRREHGRSSRSESPPPRRAHNVAPPGLHRAPENPPKHPPQLEPVEPPSSGEHGIDAGEQPVDAYDIDADFYTNLFHTLRATKSAKWSISRPSSPAAPLSRLGRLIPRVWGPFIDMTIVVTVGMAWYGGPPTHWATVSETSLSPARLNQLKSEKHCVKVFEWLQERVPFMKEIFPMMVGRAHDTFILGAFLETHSNAARATDLHSLRDSLPDYVLPVATASAPLNMIAPPNDHQRKNKHYYGFHSLWTGRLLTPRVNRDEFDENPQAFCDAVLDNTIGISDEDYPSFLYSDDEDFDPEAIDVGLCYGDLLVKAYRRVFTSASSVNKPPGKRGLGRGCISQIYKLDTVTPGSIAYIATLVRNVLSSCDSWEVKDGHFDGEHFFNRLVSLFNTEAEDADLCWISDAVVFWNSTRLAKFTVTPSFLPARRQSGGRLPSHRQCYWQGSVRLAQPLHVCQL
ncbi:hypothetical protein PYCCODRAFT_728913 [Trametes coccinea BRFM310]|uniref:Uncharacterized protein n=1 Tax=Trametes coccinea (strain BRFM310) TaxID=1353009 RepID=A0A1Y2IHN2_TRAC3|nr:hypothetical protein PYCCODRAFT_728913 [Trametes coccinea BRFM310]